MTKCLACGCSKNIEIAQNKFFPQSRIVKCRDCGTVYPSPRPKQEDVDRFYADTYYRYSKIARFVKKTMAELIARDRYNWITSHVDLPEFAHPLEIGSAYGHLVRLFHRGGYFPYGVEPSQECWDNRVDNAIYHDTFERINVSWNIQHWDLIIAVHTLEHLVAPENAIEKMSGVLSPGGWLYLELPNQNAPVYKNCQYRDVPDFYFFNRDSLELFLKRHGFVGDVFYLSQRTLFNRHDKIDCSLTLPWYCVKSYFGKPIFERGDNESFAICAVVRKEG